MGRPKIPQDILEAKEDIGDLARLQTMDKTSLVNAINEVRDSGGSGSGRGVFVSNVEQGSFVASGDTTTFTIPNMNGTKIEELIFENYQLVVGQSYSIVRSTGEVTLTFTLKQGETIYYRLFDTSYNYNELSGKPAIQDNLTTVEKGQILDASQGKILKDDINTRALKTEVGALSGLTTITKTSLVDAINESTNKINVLSANKNKILNEGLGNYDTPTKPSDYTSNSITSVALRKCSETEASEYGYWNNILAIKNHGEDNCFELGFTNNSNVIFRKQDGANDTWLPWQQIATTTKTDISYTLNGGLTFRSENDSKGEYTETLASIRIMIDVNNADIFNWDFVWCTLPPQLRPRHQLSDILLDSSTGIVSINVLPNGDIIRGNSMPETKPTWIMGYVPMYGRSM